MTTKKILGLILGGALLAVPLVSRADTDDLVKKGKNLEDQGWQLEKKGANMEKRGETGASDVQKRGKDLQKTGARLTDDAKSAERKVEDKTHDTFHRDTVDRNNQTVEKKTITTEKKIKPHRHPRDRASR